MTSAPRWVYRGVRECAQGTAGYRRHSTVTWPQAAASSHACTPGPSPAPPARSTGHGLTKPQTDLLARLGVPHPEQDLALQPTPR